MCSLRPVLIALLLFHAGTARAALDVFACEPEWAALARALGGEQVTVFSATTVRQDPHRIEARPSLIAKMRRSDLVVCTGADLEAGWLPLVVRQSGNSKVQPGQPALFFAADQVQRLEVPGAIDRARGDVHAAGNPHVHLDPRRVATIADALAARLADLDPGNANAYRARHAEFAKRWQQAVAEWSAKAKPLEGVAAVSHHKDWVYLFDWLAMRDAGTLEPRPGVPPSVGQLQRVAEGAKRADAQVILRTPYQDPRPAQWLAEHAGLPVAILPYAPDGKEVPDLFALFDTIITRLLDVKR